MFSFINALKDILNWIKKSDNLMTYEVLWRNPNISSDYSETTLTNIPWSDYDFIGAVCTGGYSGKVSVNSGTDYIKIPTNGSYYTNGVYGWIGARQIVLQSGNKILIEHHFHKYVNTTSYGTSNANCKPIIIYGIKVIKLGGVTQLLKNLFREVVPC